ncbi:F0F1 ATP synthase subunit gamma [Solimicrobium silvestre]|uniref:Alternate F1F0 ATPase, F1 subunit gamma n=1 Tax=Solimicrobium silvestre TaxID=2099400 RepID=A0A2S9GW26_9BURK|nr:F0F1 ATP synthase subunit gamma [Solimicrobium silvestre]PRC91923.1 Alternate F1F0 ATPase, F1 subunit gamma [Solimicrobium silvestre]
MSDTLASLRGKISGADKLKSVVRTMKAMAASSIGQYENAVQSLGDYERTVTLGLSACFRQAGPVVTPHFQQNEHKVIGAIVFGSDQGLVGQFNDVMGRFVMDKLDKLPGEKKIWVVGERLHAILGDANLPLFGPYGVPNSATAITQLVGRIQIDCEAHRPHSEFDYDQETIYVFHNAPLSGSQYQPVCQRLLPLDAEWQRNITAIPWPTKNLPEAIGMKTGRESETGNELLRALLREYLFISLFKACAESLVSENASRLAAMQRAEKNINELSTVLSRTFYRLRQNSIDEELFDVVAGSNALGNKVR